MYSVVLMMALSGGTESTDFGGRKCHGSDGGCHGNVAASCSGACHGKRAGLFSGHKKDKCHGAAAAPACHGAKACHGSRGGLFHRSKGCHGCTGYVAPACCGPVAPACSGGVVVPGKTMEPKAMPKESIPTPPAKTETSARATIVVTVPADARLTVDGNPTSSTSERRTFLTPALETGADYIYTIRAEVVRDGRSVIETQRVTVRGGETTNVPFTFATQTVASR
jgi:uncharacterized protein (TIGR03000 family)